MVDVNVTVDDAYAERIDGVVESLRARGMRVDSVADVVISGNATDPDELSSVDGVTAVEPAHRYQLPDPDASVQ